MNANNLLKYRVKHIHYLYGHNNYIGVTGVVVVNQLFLQEKSSNDIVDLKQIYLNIIMIFYLLVTILVTVNCIKYNIYFIFL